VVCDALVRLALHDGDWQWVESKCIAFTDHPDAEVRGTAVTCLGHLARLHHRLDLAKVLPVLARLRSDPEMGGRVGDALDDIASYVSA
jgi:hypothetical protein